MTKKQNTQPNVADNAPDGIALTESEQAEARKEGAKEAAKEAAKDTATYLTDGNLPGEPSTDRWPGKSEIMQWEHLLGLDADAFAERVALTKGDDAVPEEKVAGLLGLERAGQNRTPYVKALCKRLGVKSPYEVTAAGPGYTNDVSSVTTL